MNHTSSSHTGTDEGPGEARTEATTTTGKRADRVVDAVSAATGRLGAVVPLVALVGVLGLQVLDRGRARLHAGDPQRGASVVEWVLILGVVITIVAAVAVVVRTKLIDKSNQLDLSTP